MKQKILSLLVLLVAATGAWADELTVHDGTTTNSFVPVYGFYADAYNKCEMVMPASELSAMNGSEISAMTFYASQTSVSWGANFQVFLKEVSEATIGGFSGPGTVVYEGTLSIVDGEMTVTFTTPYTYNGGNLLIGVYITATGSYISSVWYGETVSGASVQGYNYNALADVVTPTQKNFLPKTTFTYERSNVDVTTDAAEEGALFTEATFAMPAFDVTVEYETMRDMTYQVNAYVGTTPDADYRHRVEKVDATTYWPVDITEEAQIIALFPVIDIIDAQNPKTLTYGTDYTLAIVDEQENEIDPADFDFAPGTYTVKVTGKGDYDGQIESLNKFELYFGYELTVGPGEFATYYKDENLYVDDTDAQLYTITSVGTETATATQLTIAAANTPILVKNTSEETKTFLLIPTLNDADEVTAAAEFIGTLEATTIAASSENQNNYAFNGLQFVWVMNAIPVAANKAWLSINTGVPSARGITLVFDETTGVRPIDNGQLTIDNWYDLNGRKLNGMPTKKGVYIMNGRKVVVK